MMGRKELSIQYLLSLPPAMVDCLELTGKSDPSVWFGACDPAGSKLGSGGGTAHLLAAAWQSTGSGKTFREWLRHSRKLIVHGGGQSRRLPAYAAMGKPFIPIPALRNSFGGSMQQSLLDVQLPDYRTIFEQADDDACVMITSGDVLLRFASQLPRFPKADIVAMGMSVEPEQAEHFGVFFTRKSSGELAQFLQKPPAATVTELSQRLGFLVDTGIWLMTERAVMALMSKCGWDDKAQSFSNRNADFYELYAGFGLALGTEPARPDAEIGKLTSAVVSMPSPEFYHLGTSQQLIESVTVLQNRGANALWAGMRHPEQVIQNSVFEPPANRSVNHTLWIENAVVPQTWSLDCEHVITGAPENNWQLSLKRGVCLDFAPIGESDFCIRAYGINDSFSGKIGADSTLWFGSRATKWFEERGIALTEAGIDPETDIQLAKIFPLLGECSIDQDFLQWLISADSASATKWSEWWLSAPRLSADEIHIRTNIRRLMGRQSTIRSSALQKLYAKQERSIFHRLDLGQTARLFVKSDLALPDSELNDLDPLLKVHDHIFRAAIIRERGEDQWRNEEEKSFTCLREAIIAETKLSPAIPKCCVLKDQIVWGRSPARLDLAGGWTDTPPYCLEHGGRVVNVAVNLNGQPPIQVFAKLCPRPELVIRSIDLGVEQRIRTFEELNTYSQPGSEFALAKAAVAMAGFQPEGGYSSLEKQFEAFGAGIEVSLLAAMPQGSGLGTSSILAATLLGTLSELCGLGWDRHEVICRTLAVEQMLTTGGGWQDQAGAVFGGLKLFETTPGLAQKPTVRWLPDRLFGPGYANELVLLYYTGLTRLAKNILEEIVRGMFLNSAERLRILDRMQEHALSTFETIQRNDWDGLCEAVRLSWEFNKKLDSGTNPREVQEVLDLIEDDLAAAKLLGAGGGGYMLMLAKDQESGKRIRQALTQNPPNERARFVDLSVSATGLEITRS